ncbi:hypothetical protein ACFPPD_09705 [Cohnella suwonensis]|uniref:Butirosin biosynthesis protein H N-terminal domain-containing protein n=1 Tax=Cohnella suwonensis TaxID=696072 RepID=A0ABW0LVX6_9BACL
MEDAIRLPLGQPIVSSWANHSHILSIISRSPDSVNWIYSNYIQLELIEALNDDLMLLNYSFPTTPEDACQLLDVTRCPRESVELGGGLVNFLKESLRNKQYVYLFLDAFYMLGYPFYEAEHVPHDPLIVGFDDREQVFYLADFHVSTGGIVKYGIFAVSYRQVEQSYYLLPPEGDRMNGIELFGYRADAKCRFDADLVKLYLSDYLNASFTLSKEQTWLSTKVAAYGIEIYDYLFKQLSLVKEERQAPDFRLVHVLHDHKTLMYNRLKHMNGMGYISEERSRSYGQVVKDCVKLRNSALKYGVTGNKAFLTEAQHTLQAILENEKQILYSVYVEI